MAWRDHYIALRGHDLPIQSPPLTYFGTLPTAWRVQFAAWILRETLAEVPELAPVLARTDAALAADPTPQGSAWTELYAAQAAHARPAGHGAGVRQRGERVAEAYNAILASWSWRVHSVAPTTGGTPCLDEIARRR